MKNRQMKINNNSNIIDGSRLSKDLLSFLQNTSNFKLKNGFLVSSLAINEVSAKNVLSSEDLLALRVMIKESEDRTNWIIQTL